MGTPLMCGFNRGVPSENPGAATREFKTGILARTIVRLLRVGHLAALLLVIHLSPLPAQVCSLSVAGLNRSRSVAGPIHAECPDIPVHSSPFGNWGVTSNYGRRQDAHQFDGWCHDTHTCDNKGECRNVCGDGWYEWNSCTDHPLYSPPNPSLYNASGGTAQVSTTGVNVLGTLTVNLPVRCPFDSKGDGKIDSGGCADVASYTSTPNFMTLYELDPVCCDDLIQTLYFPTTTVPLACDAWGCAPAGSDWVAPSAYDSPASPAKAFAELATVVNWGTFVNSGNACRYSVALLTAVSAASLRGPALAPDLIGSVFGDSLAPEAAQVAALPLPDSLAGVSLRVTDSTGASALAPLFYVSPSQVNFLTPRGLRTGPVVLDILRGGVATASGRAQLDPVAPGLFTAGQNGRGVASAMAVRISPGGSATSSLTFRCSAPGDCEPEPIDLGAPSDQTYLVLYGTGLRGNPDLTRVTVAIAGGRAQVLYAGPQPEYAGLDQVNILVPDNLRGAGAVDLTLNVDGRDANVVRVAFR
jgi:uncharacterized protein (TIGR03437 family)